MYKLYTTSNRLVSGNDDSILFFATEFELSVIRSYRFYSQHDFSVYSMMHAWGRIARGMGLYIAHPRIIIGHPLKYLYPRFISDIS